MSPTSPSRLCTALSVVAALALGIALAPAAGLPPPAGAAAQADSAAAGAASGSAAARSVLVIVRGSAAADAAVASSLVAAGLGDAVVFAESADSLGSDNATIIGQERPSGVLLLEHQPPHIVIIDRNGATGSAGVDRGALAPAGSDSPASADAGAQHSGLAELLAPALEQSASAAEVSTVSTFAGSTRRALEGIPVADRSVRLGFVSVSVGHDHVCGLRSNGTIACWGVGVGVGSTDTGGKARSPSGTYSAVTAGGTFSSPCSPTAPCTAGAARTSGRCTPPTAGSSRSPPAGGTRAPGSPTTTLLAGAISGVPST